MNRTLLAITISLFCFHQAFCQDQSLSITPTTVEETFSIDLSNSSLDLELYAEVKNLSSDTLMLRWERIVIDQPVEWWTQVCDRNFCFDPPISTNYDPLAGIFEPVLLEPDSAFTLIFHVLPNKQPGIGQFELTFTSIDEPETLLEKVTFVARVGNTTTINDFKEHRIQVFPNPTLDYFQLTPNNRVDEIVLYSMLGKKVKRFDAYEEKKYDVSDLPAGLYLVSLISNQEGVIKTLRLSKRIFRP